MAFNSGFKGLNHMTVFTHQQRMSELKTKQPQDPVY